MPQPLINFIRNFIAGFIFPQTYRTPAELPDDLWLSYRHGMQIDYSTRRLVFPFHR